MNPEGGFDTTGLFVEEAERAYFYNRRVSLGEAWAVVRYLGNSGGRYETLRMIRRNPEMSCLFRAHAQHYTRGLPNPVLQRFLPVLRQVRGVEVPVPATILLDLVAHRSAKHESLKPVAQMLGWSKGVPSYISRPDPKVLWELRCLDFDLRITDLILKTNHQLFMQLGRSLQRQRTHILECAERYAFLDYPVTGPSLVDLTFFPFYGGTHGLSWWPFVPT